MPDIKTFVREDVVSAAPETGIEELARLFADERVGSVVIVDGDDPVGIVTDRDIVVQAIAEGRDLESLTAADVMSDDLVTVDADAGIFDVIRTMEEANVRRIPAVDGDGHLAGMVTFDDFVVLLGRELNLLGDAIEAEIPPYEHV